MSEELEYVMECIVCDVETSIVILNDDEKPAFCPMCGEPSSPHRV